MAYTAEALTRAEVGEGTCTWWHLDTADGSGAVLAVSAGVAAGSGAILTADMGTWRQQRLRTDGKSTPMCPALSSTLRAVSTPEPKNLRLGNLESSKLDSKPVASSG